MLPPTRTTMRPINPWKSIYCPISFGSYLLHINKQSLKAVRPDFLLYKVYHHAVPGKKGVTFGPEFPLRQRCCTGIYTSPFVTLSSASLTLEEGYPANGHLSKFNSCYKTSSRVCRGLSWAPNEGYDGNQVHSLTHNFLSFYYFPINQQLKRQKVKTGSTESRTHHLNPIMPF